MRFEDVIRKDLRKMGTSWEVVKRKVLNRFGGRKSGYGSGGPGQLDAEVN